MSVINVEHISKLYGDKMILEDLSCSVDEGDKIGIIGINGTGKSTLLRIIAGEEEADEGKIIFSNGMTIGWMGQNPEFDEESSILKYVCEGKKIEDDYGYESDAKAMLTVLELENFDEKIKNLSGGQKKRAVLCKVLLQKPDILILDEPTNHLDNKMSDWLENYLKSFRGVLLMVTHDRYFLDKVTNHIWEVEGGKVYYYDENYSGYLERKAEREERELASERKRQSILRSEVKWVMRGARARSTKQKARLERFEQLKAMDSPKTAKQVEMGSVGTRLGKKTIELYDISKAYGDKVLFKHFSYIFKRFERIGFVGHNGCGKSTLMKILADLEQADSGAIEWGETIKIGYFAQECEVMDERERVIDYIKDAAEYVRTSEGLVSASKMLERFLFSSDMQYTPIAKISGGERRRLYLLKVLMQSPNVLILDEPTNDLDIATLRVLEDFLDEFAGIVITVSHDRYFLDRTVDRIAAFENGNIVVYEGDYTEYQEKSGRIEADSIDSVDSGSGLHIKKSNEKKKEGREQWLASKNKEKKLKFSYKEQKEFETIDEDIEKLEEKIAELEEQISKCATDFIKLNELMQEKEKTEAELSDKMERWVYLNDLAEKIEAQKRENNNENI
ncbi:MAG: ABC-F family ATP-binding cassette domain-containing protein [Anaerobutyricum hallii]